MRSMLSFDAMRKLSLTATKESMKCSKLEHNHAEGNHLSCAGLHSIFINIIT